ADDDRRLAGRSGLERLRILSLQGVRCRAARDPPRRLGSGLDRAGFDADPVAGERQDRQRQVAEHRQLRRAGPRVPVGLRSHRGLLRRARPERPQRLRQRRPGAWLVGLPVDLQRQRVLARLPPAAQPPGHPPLLVHPEAPPHEGVRRPADGLHAPVPLEEHRLRDAHPVARVPLRDGSAGARQRARGEHHGRRQEADPGLRAGALEQVPAGSAARGAYQRGQGWRGRVLRRMSRARAKRGWIALAAVMAVSLGALALHAANPTPPLPVGVAAPPPVNALPPANVKIVFTINPSNKKAMVFWGKKRLGIIAPHAPLVVQRPRDSGPLDVVVKSDGYLTVQTRAYTFADSKVAVKLTQVDQKNTLLGYREELPPDGGAPSNPDGGI